MQTVNVLHHATRFGIGLIAFLTLLLSGCGGGGGGGGNSNTPPVANAGKNINALLLHVLVVLDGSASSDADGDPLTYQWTITTKPATSTATLSSPSSTSSTFTPDVAGSYSVSLVVNDGKVNSSAAAVTINVLPSLSKIHDTGQLNCYDNLSTITCPTSGSAFYGQDGNYSTNPLIFTNNGSFVSDNVSGLMWQKADSGTAYNWFQAMGTYDATYNPGTVDVCGALTLGGYNDWRLPSTRELVSIFNYGQGSFDANYFLTTGANPSYWTSTSVGTEAWGSWLDGRIYSGFSKGTSALYVRCVRGAAWGQNSFVDNSNGTVTDLASSLQWQKTDDGVARNWQDALSFCEGLSLAGYSDWRLPDVKELETLLLYSLSTPAINTTFFPSTQQNYYWSSTTNSWVSDYAWYVDFSHPTVFWGTSKTNFQFTRCVR